MKRAFSSTALFAIVLWTSVIGAAVVHAGGRNAARQTDGETLTNDSLKTMLTNMGYEPKPLSKGYLLAIMQDTWTINMQVVLSGDTRKVGLNANLGKVEDPTSVTADQWMKLLISNGDIDPTAFYFDKDQKKLYLHRSFDNRAVGPVSLRREIENFSGHVRTTASLWSFAK